MPVSSVNDPDISPPPSLHPSQQAFDQDDGSPTQSPQGLLHKKKHVCTVCTRAFTTSGHLARHARIHTGERNHKCPFPGCETRCSRQDNLQQHYRIHLSPGSRRNSGSATRAAMNRANVSSRPRSSRRRSANPDPPISPLAPSPPAVPPSPPLDPPPLVEAYPEPPDTPPPLAPAYPTLQPLTAPVYAQQPLSARDSSRSSRTTPDAAYHSPVSYAHAQLASASAYGAAAQYQSDDGAITNAYPPSSHSSRASSSFGRPLADDGRWVYHAHAQGDHSYPASEGDRYSPESASPANPAGHYADPISPVDSLGGRAHYGHGDVQMSPHESAPNASYFTQAAYPRQTQNSAVPTSASPVSYPPPSQSSSLPPSVSSHRHSIAHISNPHPNPAGRQHSPTDSASPVVSTPPTPGYGYVSMGGYTESPPGPENQSQNVSPVAPAPVVPVYSSYESSSLASAGYSHPPPAHAHAPMPTHAHSQPAQLQQQHTHIGYDPSRTLPVPAPTLAREPPQQQQQLHFEYGQTQTQTQAQAGYAGAVGDSRGYSPRPVLAPIQDVRMRGAGENGGQGMRYAGAPSPQPQPQPPMGSLASVGRHQQQHAFAYHQEASGSGASVASAAASVSNPAAGAYTHPPPGYAHTHAHAGASGSYGNDGGYAQGPGQGSSSSSSYYYHPQQHAHAQALPSHAHRELSPDGEDAEYGSLELHQPQPQRHAAGAQGGGQYMQTGAGGQQGHAQGHGHGHGHGHPVWRADEYVGAHVQRGRLVQ